MCKQDLRITVRDDVVRDPEPDNAYLIGNAFLLEQLEYRRAESAGKIRILSGDDKAVRIGDLRYECLIKRFHKAGINDRSVNAVARQLLASLDRRIYHLAVSEHSNITAFFDHLSFADLEQLRL